MNKPKLLLKDQLFHRQNVSECAERIKHVYPSFENNKFVSEVVNKFPELELLARIYWIRDCLHKYLPNNYKQAVGILLKSLPPELDHTKTDNDFGDFIYSPFGYFVSTYGLKEEDIDFSLSSLEQMTMRFSAEGPIRYFINEYPKRTMAQMNKWATHSNYHVRRLATEGSRPKLPWAQKLVIPADSAVPILNKLYSDPTRYVTRSVANHLNDIAKTEPGLVVDLLKKWNKSGKQTESEMAFITKHSLRTLVKQGNSGALSLLGHGTADIEVSDLVVKTTIVNIGESLEFEFVVKSTSDKSQHLMIDYILHYHKANGKLAAKTHKLAKKMLPTGKTIKLSKKHPLKIMTTRKLYTGKHELELQINGQKYGNAEFMLRAKQ